MTTSIETVRVIDEQLTSLFHHGLGELREHRGGPALIKEILGNASASPDAGLSGLVAQGCVTAAYDNGILRGFAILSPTSPLTIRALFVRAQDRRQGWGRTLLETLLKRENPPVDAWSLPGDRAMKSIYERAGWKARLLTMSGEPRSDDA